MDYDVKGLPQNYRLLAQLLSAQVFGAVGLGFDSQASQIDTVSPPLRHFSGAVQPRH